MPFRKICNFQYVRKLEFLGNLGPTCKCPTGIVLDTFTNFDFSDKSSSAHGTPKSVRKLGRPVSQCSTDSNFSSISGIIYGQHHRSKRQPKLPKSRKQHQQKHDHKIYSTFKPTNKDAETCGELFFWPNSQNSSNPFLFFFPRDKLLYWPQA